MRITLCSVALCAGCASVGDPRDVGARGVVGTDTATAAPRTVELELGVDFEARAPDVFAVQANVGVATRTEVFAGVGRVGTFDRGHDAHELQVGARHRLVDERDDAPGLALQATATVELDDVRGAQDADRIALALVADRRVRETAFSLLCEASLADPDAALDLGFGLLGRRFAAERVGLFGELAGQYRPESPGSLDLVGTLGVEWLSSEHTVVDVALRDGFAGDRALLLGLTLAPATSW